MNDSPWMNGTTANQQQAAGTVANMVSGIFALIGANKHANHYRFKADDVVIEETARDNRAMITSGATLLLFLVVLYILWK